MKQPIFSLVWPFVFLGVGLAFFLTSGCLNAQSQFEQRGIPSSLPEPIGLGGAELGLNVYLSQYDDPSLTDSLSQIDALGIQTIKQTFYYSDPFDWEESDRIITAVSQQNLHLIPLLDGSPDNQFAPPEDLNAFAEWAGAFANRYQADFTAYIIWDEPNLTSHWGSQPVNPVEYGALLTAAAHMIRQNDPDAVIVAAPLAPTKERGPQNLAEPLFLKSLYEAGVADSFDVVAAKPYGFDTDAQDRRVDDDILNFSRPILLRELMIEHGDSHKPIWAGNWGWNALPPDWNGRPSVWGAVSEPQQAAQTIAAFQRAQLEWPWMGLMFLENWEPDLPADAPEWGFHIAGRETAAAIQQTLTKLSPDVAMPGFHLASPTGPGQAYTGGWEFSPEFGADISQTAENLPGDRVRFTFFGTDLGLRVRRADYRARLYVTIDGQPANALPVDENGSNLILTAPDPSIDELVIEPVATHLKPGIHTAEIVAARGWDQWALNGFSVGYTPPMRRWPSFLNLGAAISFLIGFFLLGRVEWHQLGERPSRFIQGLQEQIQLLLTGGTAIIVALAGWMTWGEQAAGVYRRLGDPGQLAATAAAATFFYVTPTFYLYLLSLGALFFLIYLRPAWGLALVALCFPLYVPPLLKPIFNYRFSPTEIFMLVTFTAVLLRQFTARLYSVKTNSGSLLTKPKLLAVDWAVLAFTAVATLSLFFTERLDVATNEWRVVIIEPLLFYVTFRILKPSTKELWTIVDAFLLGGLLVAGYGFFQYVTGSSELITAEGGLLRIRSFYGSPNNVGLYLGRILPVLVALVLFLPRSLNGRRWIYGGLAGLISVVLLLTFSRGAILLGMPAAFLYLFWQWQRRHNRQTLPWILGGLVAGLIGLFLVSQLPQFAGRFNLRGQTSFFRLALWQASLNMFFDHPWLGVGLDNFLYEYRGRYILNAAWQEPDLNHPHNIFLDFATRLGVLGLVSGTLLFFYAGKFLNRAQAFLTGRRLALAIGLTGTLIEIVVHGLVDHSFFLVDLAFVFMFLLATAVHLSQKDAVEEHI